MTFMDDWMAGRVTDPEVIHEHIEVWHTATDDVARKVPLHEHLGLAKHQYVRWFNTGVLPARHNLRLLVGVVGSTAYGLDREGSDVDRLGVYAEPTEAFLGLHVPGLHESTAVGRDPDIALHEARKMVKLLLSGNPSVNELLWLPEYEVMTPLGRELVGLRGAFLCQSGVRVSYLEYARDQYSRLSRGGGSSGSWSRTAKHARHIMRLLWQGLYLYRTGVLELRVDDPDAVHRFGERVADGDTDLARRTIAQYAMGFDRSESPLPLVNDWGAAETWLLRVRAGSRGLMDGTYVPEQSGIRQ